MIATKTSSTTSPTADVPIETTPLTAAERRELAANERTIERGAKAWLESGLAWQAILEKRQYREAAPTFDEYVELRGHERSAVYRLKAAAVFFQEHEPHFQRLKLRITTEYQLRPIVGCEAGDVPEILRLVARRAAAGPDGWKLPTHAIFAEARNRWLLDAEELQRRKEAKERQEAEARQRREEAAGGAARERRQGAIPRSQAEAQGASAAKHLRRCGTRKGRGNVGADRAESQGQARRHHVKAIALLEPTPVHLNAAGKAVGNFNMIEVPLPDEVRTKVTILVGYFPRRADELPGWRAVATVTTSLPFPGRPAWN